MWLSDTTHTHKHMHTQVSQAQAPPFSCGSVALLRPSGGSLCECIHCILYCLLCEYKCVVFILCIHGSVALSLPSGGSLCECNPLCYTSAFASSALMQVILCPLFHHSANPAPEALKHTHMSALPPLSLFMSVMLVCVLASCSHLKLNSSISRCSSFLLAVCS